jgi:hypothetical protein
VAVGFARLLLGVPSARSAARRAKLATKAGMLLGRIEGTLRYRTLYL